MLLFLCEECVSYRYLCNLCRTSVIMCMPLLDTEALLKKKHKNACTCSVKSLYISLCQSLFCYFRFACNEQNCSRSWLPNKGGCCTENMWALAGKSATPSEMFNKLKIKLFKLYLRNNTFYEL